MDITRDVVKRPVLEVLLHAVLHLYNDMLAAIGRTIDIKYDIPLRFHRGEHLFVCIVNILDNPLPL